MSNNASTQNLSSTYLGRIRLAIKKHLQEELEEIDVLVSQIL